jgi:hypothetical protein
MLNIETLSKIKTALGSFTIDQGWIGYNEPYLRFGYWRRTNINELQSIIGDGYTVVEDDYHDDDCGWKYMYKLVKK